MKISSSWVMAAILFLFPLPLLIYGAKVFYKLQHLSFLENEAIRVKNKALLFQKNQQKESSLLLPSDPHYLDKHIESLHFLLPEIKKLEAIVSENPENESLFKRLQHLKSKQNQLLFAETSTRSAELFREVEEVQQYSVEMNEEDLKRLLCLIEGGAIWPYGPKEGKPLFIITDFKLTKKDLIDKEKVFSVSMKLLKKEKL